MSGKKKREQAKIWKKQMEEETEKIGLRKKEALNRIKWSDEMRAIAECPG